LISELYPKGGGELHIKTYPVHKLQPITITDFGTIKCFYGRSYVAGNLPIKVKFFSEFQPKLKYSLQALIRFNNKKKQRLREL
jgi:hypothetical protein